MSILAICPCCSNTMLHYISHHRDYWFCRSCWQEMPNLAEIDRHNHQAVRTPLFSHQSLSVHRQKQIANLTLKREKVKPPVLV
ncbi:hypothetical protein [Myxosarcina sp. GI1(2024)]